MKTRYLLFLATAAVLEFLLGIEARAQGAEDRWGSERGITQGHLIKGSESPNRKYGLYEFSHWAGSTPDSATTATAVGLAPVDRSRLLYVIDSRTKWMTDKEVASFLTFHWNSDSTLLATHDSGSKHSKLRIYQVTAPERVVQLEVPDLVQIAAKNLGIDPLSVRASGQVPLRWTASDSLQVSVRLLTGSGKREATIQLRIDDQGKVFQEARQF
jgi:hypothetical protein